MWWNFVARPEDEISDATRRGRPQGTVGASGLAAAPGRGRPAALDEAGKVTPP